MIQVNQLRFHYPGCNQPTLKDLDFEIAKGEILGFLGPSGAGKSTTQKILIGLLKEYLGTITVLDKDLKTWPSDYYEKIGVCFEFPNHYLKLTALENLLYFQSLYNGKTADPRQLLEQVNLGADIDLRVSQFSKGMKIRLNFARSILHNPELLFLDEPTAGLDPVNSRIIKEIIKQKKNEGVTIFLTTHEMITADELCDRVAFLVDGKIRLIDSPRNLKLQYGKRSIRVEYRLDHQTESQEFPLTSLGENETFLKLLREREIETIHTQETTLENIFIQVTGRSLQ